MTRLTRRTWKTRIAVYLGCVACFACAYAVSAASASAATSGGHATETEQAFKKQLAAGEIKSAAFRIKDHSLHLVLKNGQHVSVHLSAPPSKKLRGELKKKGVKVAKKSPPTSKRRYIVGGAAVVLVLVIVVGGLLWWRKRRRAAREEF